MSTTPSQPRVLRSVTGVQLAQGIGHQPAKGFWADAWETVSKRPAAVAGLCWIALMAFFAVFAPVLASGHPLVLRTLDTSTAEDSAKILTSRIGRGVSLALTREALDRELDRHAPRLPTERFLEAGAGTIPDPVPADVAAAIIAKVRAASELDAKGEVASVSSPLWSNLTSIDLVLLALGVFTPCYVLMGPRSTRASRAGRCLGALVVAVIVLGLCGIIKARLDAQALDAARGLATAKAAGIDVKPDPAGPFVRRPAAPYVIAGIVSVLAVGLVSVLPVGKVRGRVVVALLATVLASTAIVARWSMPAIQRWTYAQQERDGQASAAYTLIPWSALQRDSGLDRKPPGASRLANRIDAATQSLPARGPLTPEHFAQVIARVQELGDADPAEREAVRAAAERASTVSPPVDRDELRRLLNAPVQPKFLLGTDAFGGDVLTQLLHSSRLSISIGLVSTSVAMLIGITMGALMGYFGGWVDLLLYRVVEIFMAVPVLFLLIVAVAVLPPDLRTTYVMMAIIGCFTWTGMARFTRAEFLKLRNQDFVQAAQAVGLPLRSILFKHMLPNGIAPVLVDTTFAIAAAISIEATLSYLGLGPADSPSWGALLSSAMSSEGEFKWWLAVFPGAAIFLTVLAYNLVGEALRDAIDPRLKKARV